MVLAEIGQYLSEGCRIDPPMPRNLCSKRIYTIDNCQVTLFYEIANFAFVQSYIYSAVVDVSSSRDRRMVGVCAPREVIFSELAEPIAHNSSHIILLVATKVSQFCYLGYHVRRIRFC
ncbi:hypothetical protein RPD_2759 [Rhodopseudomonas palustris BisB5]|uniref:Uncharacterized protein n=1 Tax=Rhodopseudomonas palustris (strain BisB5) TaxID=316057 RepID=Q136K2_RHOPS|nr:hypothetical protein RPD_2759 [Rhodopseudomonas palustris BisB5]